MMSWTSPAQRSPGAGSSSSSTGRGHLSRWHGAGRLSVASTHPPLRRHRTRLVALASATPSTPPRSTTTAPVPSAPATGQSTAARLVEQLVQSVALEAASSAASSSQESLAELRHIHSHMSKLVDAQAEQARAIAGLAARVEKVEAALSRESRTQRLQAALLMPEAVVRQFLVLNTNFDTSTSDLNEERRKYAWLCYLFVHALSCALRGERAGYSSADTQFVSGLGATVHALTGIKPEVIKNEDGTASMYIP